MTLFATLFDDFKRCLYLNSPKRLKEDPSQLSEARIIQFLIETFTKQGITIPSTFLEIGANHPFYLSTSWYLEHTLGFNGISVDPITRYNNLYKKMRPHTKLFNYIVVDSSVSHSDIDFFEAPADVFSTADVNEYQKLTKAGIQFCKKRKRTININQLSQFMQDNIGILILDIESAKQQLLILKEIVSNNKNKPYIVCVETIEYQGGKDWDDKRDAYDQVLEMYYVRSASTFLNTMYTLKL